MSLRRRSCTACFRSRRKCDFGLPSCSTCQRTNKTCRYVYASITQPATTTASTQITSPGTSATSASSVVASDTSFDAYLPLIDDTVLEAGFDFDSWANDSSSQPLQHHAGSITTTSPAASITPELSLAWSSLRLLGYFGEVRPLTGSNESWQWTIDQLKSYPREFAHKAQTLFIHPALYRQTMPRPIRQAFGVCSAQNLVNEANSATFFRVLDAEVLELLQASEAQATLLDELARVQALLLYQTMRLFCGRIEQHVLAEQQQGVLMASALKLVARSQVELRGAEAVCWASWVLAECIRRTALVVYMLYGVDSIVRQGVCVGFHTLTQLPMSTALGSWTSETDHGHGAEPGRTVTYEAFSNGWLAVSRKPDPLEKFLLVPCKGLRRIESGWPG